MVLFKTSNILRNKRPFSCYQIQEGIKEKLISSYLHNLWVKVKEENIAVEVKKLLNFAN